MGVEVAPREIYTAAAATVDYVLQRFGGGHSANARRPRVFNLSTEGVFEMLEGKVEWVAGASEPCDAVICGVPLNVYATEERQRIAMLLIRRGAALVGICADRVYPSPRGLEFGVGAMAAMLAYATDVTPIFCGKPEKIFFHELCDRLGVKPADCVLIGDNLESDIAGGKGVGMRTILALTGVSSRQDAQRLPPELRPDAVIGDLRELVR
jgi:4-nitrophenyl phosphatase